MTLSEFKAWFEGYTEGLEGAPTKAQFDRIKEKVKEIRSETPTTYPVFIDRYVKPYREYWQYGTGGYGLHSDCVSTVGAVSYSPDYKSADNNTVVCNAQEAFRDLGRADAKAVA